MTAVAVFEVAPHVGHQFFHVTTQMVSSDIRVKVLPDALDLVVIRTVRRQEVQHDASLVSLERLLDDLTTVDAIVV